MVFSLYPSASPCLLIGSLVRFTRMKIIDMQRCSSVLFIIFFIAVIIIFSDLGSSDLRFYQLALPGLKLQASISSFHQMGSRALPQPQDFIYLLVFSMTISPYVICICMYICVCACVLLYVLPLNSKLHMWGKQCSRPHCFCPSLLCPLNQSVKSLLNMTPLFPAYL